MKLKAYKAKAKGIEEPRSTSVRVSRSGVRWQR